jgi:hypothetical protein
MSGELARRIAAAPIKRERDREDALARKEAEVAIARVAGVALVGEAALMGVTTLGLMARQAAALVPEEAARLDLIKTTAAIGMAQQINRLAGGG